MHLEEARIGPTPWWHWLATVGGWMLAASGVALLLWALFWDRSRGRKRCPKCWYHMAGVPAAEVDGQSQLTCPECGLQVRRPARLLKTRRRWRWVAPAFVLMAAGWLGACIPAIRADGWWAAAPRPVLIAMIPWVERDGPRNWGRPPGKLVSQIEKRLFPGRWWLAGLVWPERWMMERVCIATLNRDRGSFTKSLAARGLALTRDDPLALVGPAGKGYVVIAKSGLVYARATSYFDRGMVKGSIGVRDETPFITAFDRTRRRFRFEFLSGHPYEHKFSMRYAVWADGDDIRSWWTIKPKGNRFNTLSMALAGPTGVSGGSANNIPSLLLTDQLTSRFLFADTVEYGGEGSIDGHRCVRVNISTAAWPETVLIDAESFLVRRIESSGQYPSTTSYDPKLNVDLGPEWFEFDPDRPERSPLQDRGAGKWRE